SIVSAELWLGVAASRDQARNRAAVIEFLRFVSVLDWPADAARIYGDLRAHLERTGRVIGAMDMLIAAHSLHERATLITDNLAEFRRVPELKLENWIR
ncbi:MAG TPA: type II toxin-antitoxin system VapC family toxin, partial [Candidatus Binataceae bacterium]|nr:type II toxin-antitoxin system VapC family toxin [Candidatus Binataceae bacterium]